MKRPIVITLLVIALTFVCLGIAAVIFFTANGGFPTNNPFDMRNIPSKLEESKTLKVDIEKPLTLKVADDAGGVTITGAEVDTVQVKVIKTAYDSSQSRADKEVKGIKYTIEQTDGTIILKYELPKSMNFNNKINTVDFVVTVPSETTVNVNTSMGEVSVSDIKGNVEIINNFGKVTVENVEGALTIKNDSGAIKATAIKAGSADIDLQSSFGGITLEKVVGGNITLHSSSGAINLSNVRASGDLKTKSDFGGTSYENGSADSLTVGSSSGRVSLVKLIIRKEIKVEDDFGEIELQQALAGSYDLHTSSGAITVEGAKNKLKAYTDFGGIIIKNAESVILDLKTSSGTIRFNGSLGKGPHLVKSDFGGIDFALPADTKLNVDLTTDFGAISSDIPLTVTLDGSTDKNHQIGIMNGGGDQLTIKTGNGNISIQASQ